ncbi:threonine/serine exporter family protein [Alteromonas sp. ASW11-36]|uniref:Threonine/serine exporter family protein n=1 Tax=Alteromonas arenosi TaxID=3055817 RepID=A0ABT7SUR3_9ALTE|nr:threonine/serine exporter family protein [Alteromonas sp. ASW11-36]MDM7859928.1 threonine/serine exporter family protein [Alteromonas sp. ASW11-36]
MDKQEFIQIRKFIVKLGKMLHKYGTPAFRWEAHMSEVAAYLNVHAGFISTPTSLTFVIWSDKHEDEYNHAARVQPGDIDLGSLSRTDELVNKLLAGEYTLAEANERLDEIDELPNFYNSFLTCIAFGLSTGAFAIVMGASLVDAYASGFIGLIMYLFAAWAMRSKRVNHMLEVAVALVAGLCACAISSFIDPAINIRLVVLSSIIIFIPGLALTIGLAELSSRHLVSGTARVMDALMQLFKLYFGAFLGIALGFTLFSEVAMTTTEALPKWAIFVAVLILCSALVIIFKIRIKHAPWAITCGFIGYFGTYWASKYLEFGLGTFVGAFAVGVFANLFTRIANAPASIVLMQGLIVLVPGSKTYIGLNSFVSGQDFVSTDHIGQETFVIFMSLVAGLIFANVIMPTKKAL